MPQGFRFEQYDDRGSNIGALMMAPAQAQARALRESGQARARATEISGQAWGGAVQNIGSIISNGLQQYAQHKADAPVREMQGLQLADAKAQRAAGQQEAKREQRREAAFTELLSRGDVNPREILTIYGPERGSKIAQGLEAFAKIESGQVQDARAEAGRLAAGFLSLSPALRQQLAPQIRAAAIKGGLGTEETIPTDLPEDFLRGVVAWSKGDAPKQPEPYTLNPGDVRFGPDNKQVAAVEPKAPDAPNLGSFEDYVTRFAAANGRKPAELSPADIEQARKRYNQSDDRPRITIQTGGGGGGSAPPAAITPAGAGTQDLLSQAGLSYNAFMVLTGRTSQLGRDAATRNKATAEVQAWARSRGMDVSTLASQYKAYNEVLENNIQRYNRTVMAEGEIAASVANLAQAAKDSGLGDARAVNAAKQWLKGELNDPNAAQYAFFLNQLTNDIALYNAASQGRAALQADLDEAKGVVRRGISTGSLQGMQRAITMSVEKMGTVLEGGVNRAQQDVWNLFGVGDKYKPKTRKPAPTTTANPFRN